MAARRHVRKGALMKTSRKRNNLNGSVGGAPPPHTPCNRARFWLKLSPAPPAFSTPPGPAAAPHGGAEAGPRPRQAGPADGARPGRGTHRTKPYRPGERAAPPAPAPSAPAPVKKKKGKGAAGPAREGPGGLRSPAAAVPA